VRGAVETAILVLAFSVPVTALGVGAAFWFLFRQQEKHMLLVLDRFLSRNISDYAMTDLVRREIEADQGDAGTSEEEDEEKAFETYLANRQAAVQALEVNQ
jgi:hypothetical protein